MTYSKNLKIDMPIGAKKIISTLNENGFEAFIVGGCVRDCILGRAPEDWDITTKALPNEVKSLFSHVIDTGIEHGTVTVLMDGGAFEVTTYRVDGKYSDGRHPDKVLFTPSLEEDLKRRDFTINAFAYNEERGIIDLFNGLSDLENGIIRAVGEPDRRFDEDALRIMRAVRFSSQLSFKIEEETYDSILKHAPNLQKISMERIRVEFEKTLMSKNPEFVNLYKELGLSSYIIRSKEICDKCFDKDSEKLYKRFDADEKLDLKYLRLAAFFKNLGEEEAKEIIRSLTYDNKTRDHVSKILKFKDKVILPDRMEIKISLFEMGDEDFDLVVKYKKALLDSEIKSGFERCAQARDERNLEDIEEIAEDIRKKGEPYKLSMLDITGKDLIAAGIPAGDEIGKKLLELLYKTIKNPKLNEKEKLLEII